MDFIILPWNQVLLAHQARHPEAMDHVGGGELDLDRLANWNVDLIRGGDDLVGRVAFVANVPPPLLAGNLDSDGRILLREQLPLRDIAHSTQTDHNEHGCKHRAADDRNAAALRPWLQSQRIGPFRRTAQEPSQQHDHHGKPDRSADGGEQPDQKREMLGLRSLRIERGLPAAAGAKKRCRR